MYKVLKHGTKIHKAICDKCGCEFLVSENEGKWYTSSNGQYVEINCPDCHMELHYWDWNHLDECNR